MPSKLLYMGTATTVPLWEFIDTPVKNKSPTEGLAAAVPQQAYRHKLSSEFHMECKEWAK